MRHRTRSFGKCLGLELDFLCVLNNVIMGQNKMEWNEQYASLQLNFNVGKVRYLITYYISEPIIVIFNWVLSKYVSLMLKFHIIEIVSYPCECILNIELSCAHKPRKR